MSYQYTIKNISKNYEINRMTEYYKLNKNSIAILSSYTLHERRWNYQDKNRIISNRNINDNHPDILFNVV